MKKVSGFFEHGHEPDATAPLKSVTGETVDGVPLAYNRPPAQDLQPWVGRMMVAYAYDPTKTRLSGMLCNDSSYLRTAVGVDWVAGTADGPLEIRDETFLCGQHSRAMPLDYTGGIKVAGIMLRPGAMRALWGLDDGELIDRIRSIEAAGIPDAEVTGLFNLDLEPKEWLVAMEEWLRQHIERTGAPRPDAVSAALELQAFADPNRPISEFADEHAVTIRTLQRITRRDFGLTPKAIMRRARVLDFAARLCGVADEEEEAEIILRFFDDAHLAREFKAFFAMSPRTFRRNRQGLLTLSLEIRQARRLEMLDRLSPEAVRPWMREPFAQPQAGAR